MHSICYSSEIYNLDPLDIYILKDSDIEIESDVKDEVVVLMGHNQIWIDKSTGTADTLIKGREILENAIKNNLAYIPVRIAFVPLISKYDFITPLVRVMRYKRKFYSSNIYHIDPFEIREKKIERNYRSKENAYQFSNPKHKVSEDERVNMYSRLCDSMSNNGYDDRFPVDIMLCRNMGVQDTLNQGHHRVGVAIDCNIHRIAVMFSAVGKAPRILRPILKVIAKLNLLFKK